MDECRILSPLGMLGYGFPPESFEAGLARQPHVIAADAGSTDGGPHKLGAGVGIVSRMATKKDLGTILRGGLEVDAPIIIGSAGGSGADVHLAWTLEILEELIREQGCRVRVAYIHAELDKEFLKAEVAAGRIRLPRNVPPLTDKAIDSATRIVAQMGAEPIIRALEAGAQVIVAGRAYDPACFAAYALWKGFPAGPAWHLGKILECGALCAEPGSPGDGMLGVLRRDGFVVEPLNPTRACTETSVAAHTLYEKSHPYLLPGPGGTTNLSSCTFRQLTERTVEVRGSSFAASTPYTVKLEGAELVAYRTVSSGFERLLKAWGVEQLVLTGVSTNSCVEGTARDAADRGYRCLLVEDGCGAQSQRLHDATCENFQRLMGRVASAATVMTELEPVPESTSPDRFR